MPLAYAREFASLIITNEYEFLSATRERSEHTSEASGVSKTVKAADMNSLILFALLKYSLRSLT